MKIPSKKECIELLHKNKTPSHVIEHCKAVCKAAEKVANRLIKRGIKLDKNLVIAGALLHDVERAKKEHVPKGVKLLRKLSYLELQKS